MPSPSRARSESLSTVPDDYDTEVPDFGGKRPRWHELDDGAGDAAASTSRPAADVESPSRPSRLQEAAVGNGIALPRAQLPPSPRRRSVELKAGSVKKAVTFMDSAPSLAPPSREKASPPWDKSAAVSANRADTRWPRAGRSMGRDLSRRRARVHDPQVMRSGGDPQRADVIGLRSSRPPLASLPVARPAVIGLPRSRSDDLPAKTPQPRYPLAAGRTRSRSHSRRAHPAGAHPAGAHPAHPVSTASRPKTAVDHLARLTDGDRQLLFQDLRLRLLQAELGESAPLLSLLLACALAFAARPPSPSRHTLQLVGAFCRVAIIVVGVFSVTLPCANVLCAARVPRTDRSTH